MPALPEVANVVRIDLQWEVGEDHNIITRLHSGYTGSEPNTADCSTLAGEINTVVEAELRSLLPIPAIYQSCRVTDLANPSSGDATVTAAVAGTRTGTQLPAGVCTLVNYSISRRYRGGKPRSYFPFGVAADQSDSQTWGVTYQGLVNAGVAGFLLGIDGLAGGSTTLDGAVNVSYYNGFTVVTNPTTHRARNVPTLRTTPVVDKVNSATCASKLASQRRRYLR